MMICLTPLMSIEHESFNSFCSNLIFSVFRIKRDIDQILKELLPTNDGHDISVRDKDGKNFWLFVFPNLQTCLK